MSKIIASFFISLDGVVEAPDQWHFPYYNEELDAAVDAGVATSGAVLMGRKVYDEFSQFWPTASDDMPFTAFINSVPKFVLSDSLTTADWNNTTIVPGSDAVAAITKLKETAEGDITMSGSATTVRWLIANGLLDELNLLVHPIAVGTGARLFTDTHQPLELVSSTTFTTGVLHLVYRPVAAPPTAGA